MTKDGTDVYLRGAPQPAPNDMVQVCMTEQMARRFEARCLGKGNTRGDTRLEGPLLFSEDSLPTYIIGVTDSEARRAAPPGINASESETT